MNDQDLEKIEGVFARHIGVFAESVNHKFDLLVEGHQMLSEQMHQFKADVDRRFSCVEHKLDITAARGDVTASKLDTIAEKLDGVAADLKTHRADTEAHQHIYGVKET